MSGGIFINYRRGDQAGFVGRLYDRLEHVFPKEKIFMDVDDIPPGMDYVEVLSGQVRNCDVMLAVIGDGWLDARDSAGNRRIDQDDDFVRIEIASALEIGKRVIPVLIGAAAMVREADLPPSLRSLARRHAVRITHERFRADCEGLIGALRTVLPQLAAARAATPSIGSPNWSPPNPADNTAVPPLPPASAQPPPPVAAEPEEKMVEEAEAPLMKYKSVSPPERIPGLVADPKMAALICVGAGFLILIFLIGVLRT